MFSYFKLSGSKKAECILNTIAGNLYCVQSVMICLETLLWHLIDTLMIYFAHDRMVANYVVAKYDRSIRRCIVDNDNKKSMRTYRFRTELRNKTPQ